MAELALTSAEQGGAIVVHQDISEAVAKRLEEAKELEEKLKFIQENVPTRVYNVCGSSAGAGSGDFHQYRMIRRQEQMRLQRIEDEAKRQTETQEYEAKRLEKVQQLESKTAKKRSKRLKKKERKRAKQQQSGAAAGASDGQASEDSEQEKDVPEVAPLD